MKRCPHCGETKPETAFYRNKATRDGLTCYCKPCAKASAAQWAKEHREAHNASSRRWRQAHCEQYRAQHAAYEKQRRRRIGKTKRSAEEIAARHKQAHDLRCQGRTCAEIGEMLGLSPRHVAYVAGRVARQTGVSGPRAVSRRQSMRDAGRWLRSHLAAAVEVVPDPTDSLVISLYYGEGAPYAGNMASIARWLGVSRQRVAQRHDHAIAVLREVGLLPCTLDAGGAR